VDIKEKEKINLEDQIAALRVIKRTCANSQADQGCRCCPYGIGDGIGSECIFKTAYYPSCINVMDMPTKAYVEVGAK